MDQKQNPVVAFLRAFPPWAEFAFVIVVAFGDAIASSLVLAFEFVPGKADKISAEWFESGAIFDTAFALVIAGVLAARHWRFSDVGLDRPKGSDLGIALVLLATVYALNYALWYFIAPTPLARWNFGGFVLDQRGIHVGVLAASSVINALFEEVFVCAYVLSGWRGRRMWDAITTSAAIRLSYHLYQGPLAVFTIGPLGILFAWFYATRGRLWPLVIAHALLDFVPFLPYAHW